MRPEKVKSEARWLGAGRVYDSWGGTASGPLSRSGGVL